MPLVGSFFLSTKPGQGGLGRAGDRSSSQPPATRFASSRSGPRARETAGFRKWLRREGAGKKAKADPSHVRASEEGPRQEVRGRDFVVPRHRPRSRATKSDKEAGEGAWRPWLSPSLRRTSGVAYIWSRAMGRDRGVCSRCDAMKYIEFERFIEKELPAQECAKNSRAATPREAISASRRLQTISHPRQLVALTTFSDLVLEARAKALEDARAAGMAADPTPLANGGTGAHAYADAVAVLSGFRIEPDCRSWHDDLQLADRASARRAHIRDDKRFQ